MTSPSRLIFWRVFLALTGILAILSVWQMFGVAHKLGIAVQTSKTWLALLGGLGLLGLASFLGAGFTFSTTWLGRFNFLDRLPRWLAAPLLAATLLAYPLLLTQPYASKLIGKADFVRLLVFWLIAFVGASALRLLWKNSNWPAAFALILILQASANLVFGYLTDITAYPFALGWSETSRYYYPSLFLAQKLYGQPFPWPILHPSLHLALVPPYWFDAPLWFHRAWQVFIRFLFVGGIAPALLTRLNIASRPIRYTAGAWIFLTLFDLPLYLHLAPPVILILWGFSVKNARRTWIFLLLASVWAGLSRLNWYPMPGMLAAALYLLEVPFGKATIDHRPQTIVHRLSSIVSYLTQPVAWFVAGSATAFLSMRAYITLSGISQAGDFYTSLTSSLLWYRLWPNATYALGVLPGILLYSFPMWIVLGVAFLRRELHPLRMGLLLLGLAVLFVGGIFVSMKIGGGGDIHNMDAYAVALLIIAAHLFFGRYTPENGAIRQPVKFHWVVVALLVLVSAWFGQRASTGFVSYDSAASQVTLTALQKQVDKVNAEGGEILFITQRHLIAMKMLHSVKLIPEYEREELMEMAMADNQAYLDQFKADIRAQRFAAIVVDPLEINLLGSKYAMGEENNAWVRFVARPVICNYRPAQAFAADHIVIYAPQADAPACP